MDGPAVLSVVGVAHEGAGVAVAGAAAALSGADHVRVAPTSLQERISITHTGTTIRNGHSLSLLW